MRAHRRPGGGGRLQGCMYEYVSRAGRQAQPGCPVLVGRTVECERQAAADLVELLL